LVWIGDIASWIWVGNGFVIDIVLAVIAIAITIFTVMVYRRYKERKESKQFTTSDISEKDNQFTCINCGEQIATRKGHCSACGTPRPVCVVCYSTFRRKDTIVKLPCCSNYAHKEHITNFIEIKGHCPKCHQEIKINALEEVHF
jgi:hypothetical protein